MNPKVKASPLFLLLTEISSNTVNPFCLKEQDIYPFICRIKLQVKALMASDIPTTYNALLSLCNLNELD